MQFKKVGDQAQVRGGDLLTYRGLCIGHHERTGAALFLTPDGAMRGTRVIRLPEALRWDTDFLQTCTGLPWKFRPMLGMLQPADTRGDVGAGVATIVAMAAPRQEVRER